MSPEQLRFTLAFRRLLRLSELLDRLPLPRRLKRRLALRLGRHFSPYRRDLPKALRGLHEGLGLPAPAVRAAANLWLGSHGLFALSLFDWGRNPRWGEPVLHGLMPETQATLKTLVRTGGLVLTFHSFHHNALGVVLGDAGTRVYGIAATEKNSPEAPYTGRFMRLINGGSEAHFRGGRYLFTDEMKNLVRGVREAFAGGHSVVTLSDNPVPAAEGTPVAFLGKRFCVGGGVVALAREAGVPVYFALLYPRPEGGYRLALQAAGPVTDVATTLQAYFGFLDRELRVAPWAWQGWAWFADL